MTGLVAGPTYPEVSRRLRLREQIAAHRQELIARWRSRNPWATCGDACALILAELERDFGMASRQGRAERRA